MAASRTRNDQLKPPRRARVTLPDLRAFTESGLEPDGDYDGLRLADLDLTGSDGGGARFMDCGLFRCGLDEARLSSARFIDSLLEEVRGVGTDFSGATLRDCEVVDARLGGVQLHGAVLERVVVRGGKIDFLNLRAAQLTDVLFEDCVLVEPDFQGAKLTRVTFDGCTISGADLSAAALKDVDLRRAAELGIARGVDRLSGAVISPEQLLSLAPAFAAQVGVAVRPV
ncbi:pentapeptide repeat-containing protein [Streptomyces boninensis]|uniref:pentapeptide repeat-containing protein n=1 Tax=Streptomyces boninensis TaxID=2039455 RepID=UPI003B20DAFA